MKKTNESLCDSSVFNILLFDKKLCFLSIKKMNNTQFTHKCMISNHNIRSIIVVINILKQQ